jgi:chemotaxis signal transduction protein
MNPSSELGSQSFVLLRLGERRFAIAAIHVAELVSPSRIFRFPNRTPKLEGVILRRGRIIPVCDVAESLLGRTLASRRFYLIAVRHYPRPDQPYQHHDQRSHNQRSLYQDEWIALPVSGDCELIGAEMIGATENDAPHVAGWISHGGEVIEVLNLDALTPGDRVSDNARGMAPALEARP